LFVVFLWPQANALLDVHLHWLYYWTNQESSANKGACSNIFRNIQVRQMARVAKAIEPFILDLKRKCKIVKLRKTHQLEPESRFQYERQGSLELSISGDSEPSRVNK
jgi:hypothetical protein